MFKSIVTLIILVGTTFNSLAVTSIDQITNSVIEFVRQNAETTANQELKIKPANIDSRTQFPECGTFEYALPTGKVGHNTTILITCDEHPNWRLYVPTRVTWLSPIVVVNQQTASGKSLDTTNMTIQMQDQSRIRATHYTDIDLLIGAKLKRRLAKDDPITSQDICLICKGDPVIIQAGVNGLSLSAEGTALSDGNLGDIVRVRNNQSQRQISGNVAANGKVSIKM